MEYFFLGMAVGCFLGCFFIACMVDGIRSDIREIKDYFKTDEEYFNEESKKGR